MWDLISDIWSLTRFNSDGELELFAIGSSCDTFSLNQYEFVVINKLKLKC